MECGSAVTDYSKLGEPSIGWENSVNSKLTNVSLRDKEVAVGDRKSVFEKERNMLCNLKEDGAP